MQIFVDAVEAFHQKMNVDFKQQLPPGNCQAIIDAGQTLLVLSTALETRIDQDDKRFLRAHLLVEELGETLVAMGNGDEVEALDGLCDLLYTLLGTAITYKWPLIDAFAEVHVSNMTKTRREDDSGRIRDKGDNFKPPNIKGLLEAPRPPKNKAAQSTLRAMHDAIERLMEK